MVDYTKDIDKYLNRLFPITRSLTGEGNRYSLKILQELAPIKILEYPSGQQVYDWTIPDEWNVEDAYIKDQDGERIVDFKESNLHVVNYSMPVNGKMTFAELKEHLHFDENKPDAIPYRTSYYQRKWGFCCSHNDYIKKFNNEDEYEVHIDATLKPGSMSIGELLVKGKSTKEYLISTYICHPALANDNLSGSILTAFLAHEISKRDLNYSYRFIFVPETIGAIAYCANNEDVMKNIDAAFVVTTVGGPGKIGYKQSFDPCHYINRIVEDELKEDAADLRIYPFDIHGSDERQFSSPGLRINTVSIVKDKYYEYEAYHTSKDDLDFVCADNIQYTLSQYLKVIEALEARVIYRRRQPYGEIMLSKHDLYPKTGGAQCPQDNQLNELDCLLWVLFYCDGKNSIADIAYLTKTNEATINDVFTKLVKKELVERV